jgi:DNA-binding LytR/AlgR family response regulator
MKVLIVEDEPLAAEHLVELLTTMRPHAQVVAVLDTVAETVAFLEESPKLDLIFLDVHLADGKAFSIFDRLEVEAPIVFTTAYEQYAINAFSLNSIDYLLKPLQEDKLRHALDKYDKQHSEQPSNQGLKDIMAELMAGESAYKNRFLVKVGKKLLPFSTADVSYFNAKDKSVLLVDQNNRTYPIDYTLEELEGMLNPKLFFRANRSYLVHIDSVKEVVSLPKSKLKLVLKQETPDEEVVSYAKAADLKEWLRG